MLGDHAMDQFLDHSCGNALVSILLVVRQMNVTSLASWIASKHTQSGKCIASQALAQVFHQFGEYRCKRRYFEMYKQKGTVLNVLLCVSRDTSSVLPNIDVITHTRLDIFECPLQGKRIIYLTYNRKLYCLMMQSCPCCPSDEVYREQAIKERINHSSFWNSQDQLTPCRPFLATINKH